MSIFLITSEFKKYLISFSTISLPLLALYVGDINSI